ncbi:hypothetical protein BDQ17DRAFT_1390868 [Cyathus striatus]|nr:hypothetical protein BDQ17DRAFT_1390868 [Cyathus striatus]
MSPRASASATASSSSASARTASAPYSRRPASQPKSSRQQFSACGACRMRRVRCDLKDLPIASAGPNPACSNCKERGIKCVDEFADVKAVKLLRRGRRLQQVEAIYGKVNDNESGSSIIPTLHSEFFISPFWHWFTIQRPVLDAEEFSSRFIAHTKGTQSLGNEGGLIAMLLVVWAATFGLDERGNHESLNRVPLSGQEVKKEDNLGGDSRRSKDSASIYARRERRDRAESMLREVLELIDFHGVMRRPTLDGARVLLLILPLLEDAQPLERLVIHEAALSQVQALCSLGNSSSMSSLPALSHGLDDAGARMRLFWYAYMHEGLSTGLRGGRFVLSLPPLNLSSNNSELHSPSSPSSPLPNAPTGSAQLYRSAASKTMLNLTHLLATPLRLSDVCRKVHATLTGLKASRRAEDHGLIDANGMREIWRDLENCWQELESLRRNSTRDGHGISHRLITEQYVACWQIVIFECHNIIRESLKQFISGTPTPAIYANSRPSSHSSASSPYLPPHHLHAIASRNCTTLLPIIIRIIQRNLGSGLFLWDAGLVRDGCFFAAYLAGSMEGELLEPIQDERAFKPESSDEGLHHLTVEDAVITCITALSEMRWAFSKSEEREETVRMVWETIRRQGSSYDGSSQGHSAPEYRSTLHQLPPMFDNKILHTSSHSFHGISSSDRPFLPPLNLDPTRRTESAPATACSTSEGSVGGGWPTYTPPGTASTTSTGTGFSARGSPVFRSIGYKTHPEDTVYQSTNELDPFSFHAPMTDPLVRASPAVGSVASFGHRNSPIDPQALGVTSSSAYIGGVFGSTSSVLTHAPHDFNGCPQFGDNCNASYH